MKLKILLVIFILSHINSLAQFKLGFTAGAQLSVMKFVNATTDSRLTWYFK